MEIWDVAVVGGGPAGATAALVLARAGLRVLLAQGASSGARLGEGLPPNTRPLLRALGVLDQVLAGPHRTSHGTLSAWGSCALRGNDYIHQLHGPGLQLDRTAFDATLRAAAVEAGAHCVLPARLELARDSRWSETGLHRLVLRTPGARRLVQCRWLIDATGRVATLGRRLGAVRRGGDALTGFALRLRSAQHTDHCGSTLVEAVHDGWWYSVLLPDGDRLAAFLSDIDLIDRGACRTAGGLWDRLGRTDHLRALCATHGHRPHRFVGGAPAGDDRLAPSVGPGWLAVGDAALAFDPLSSKGIANALYTGMRGAEAARAALDGAVEAPAAYAAHLEDIGRACRRQLAEIYATERRWPTAPFWRRRAGDGAVLAAAQG